MASGELGRENLARALDGLAAAIALDTTRFPEFVCDVIDSGRIQKFEYSVELFWKHLRGCLLAEGLDVPNSPRAAINFHGDSRRGRRACPAARLAVKELRHEP